MVKKWDWAEAQSRLVENSEALGIVDQAFIKMCSDLIAGNAYAESARGFLARKIFGPLVFNAEARSIYRYARENKAITWWDEQTVFVLSNARIFHKKETCIDLEVRETTIWNYSVKVKNNSLIILLSDVFLKQIKADITSILLSCASPQRKIHAISSRLETVHRWAKHSPNTGPQRKALGAWVQQKIGVKLLAANPKLAQYLFDIGGAPWDPKFYPRGSSGLLDNSLTIERWVKWWGPRR